MEYDFDRPLIIVGCGGHSKVVTDVAEAQGFRTICYVDTRGSNTTFLGRAVYPAFPGGNCYFIVAIGDNCTREIIFNQILKENPNAIGVSLIHPTSCVSARCTMKDGVVVMPHCVINSSVTIGRGVIINTHAVVEHDTIIHDFSSLAPGVVMGGSVNIGTRAAICLGARVKHGVSIGDDVIVGAASLVLRDIVDACVAYGSPAKIIRLRQKNERYL